MQTSNKWPLQAKLFVAVAGVAVMAIAGQSINGRKRLDQMKIAVTQMDTADQDERLERSKRLSQFAMADQIRGVTHDRPSLKGFLTVKDGYDGLSTDQKTEVNELAYLAAFGLPNETKTFDGTLEVQNLSGESVASYVLVDGKLKIKE